MVRNNTVKICFVPRLFEVHTLIRLWIFYRSMLFWPCALTFPRLCPCKLFDCLANAAVLIRFHSLKYVKYVIDLSRLFFVKSAIVNTEVFGLWTLLSRLILLLFAPLRIIGNAYLAWTWRQAAHYWRHLGWFFFNEYRCTTKDKLPTSTTNVSNRCLIHTHVCRYRFNLGVNC